MNEADRLTQGRIFRFWAPLAAVWLILAAEQPAITAVIARLPEATTHLAAFGLTFSLVLIVESPVTMLLTATTALATHQQAYRRLLLFAHILVLATTVAHLLLGLTPGYTFVLRRWIGVPENVIGPGQTVFLLMVPWTAMVAYRRFYEGILIHYGHPKRVSTVLLVRLLTTLFVLAGGLGLARWPGAAVGAVAASAGATTAAIAAWFLSRCTIRDEMPPLRSNSVRLEWRRLVIFYVPLALSTLIMMLAQPVLAFGLSRAAQPLASLAVWTVLMAVVLVGRSTGIVYQEVAVALLGGEQAYRQLRRFAWTLAAGSTLLFALFALTPAAALWYRHVAGLEPALVPLARVPTVIVALIPGLNVLIVWQRALLVHRENTATITSGIALNLATLVALTTIVVAVTSVPGVILVAGVLTTALAVEFLFLSWQTHKSRHQPCRESRWKAYSHGV